MAQPYRLRWPYVTPSQLGCVVRRIAHLYSAFIFILAVLTDPLRGLPILFHSSCTSVDCPRLLGVGIINETETQHDYRILPITDVRVIFHVGYWMYFHATVLLGSTMIFIGPIWSCGGQSCSALAGGQCQLYCQYSFYCRCLHYSFNFGCRRQASPVVVIRSPAAVTRQICLIYLVVVVDNLPYIRHVTRASALRRDNWRVPQHHLSCG